MSAQVDFTRRSFLLAAGAAPLLRGQSLLRRLWRSRATQPRSPPACIRRARIATLRGSPSARAKWAWAVSKTRRSPPGPGRRTSPPSGRWPLARCRGRGSPACPRLPPQVGPQPMHPVRQNISGHSEVCGDIGVSPAVYNPALQQPAVVRGQVPEEGAKPIRCSLHCGDLGHVTGGGGAPGVTGTSLRLRVVPPPKYLEACPRPKESPGGTRAGRRLGHGGVFQGGWGFQGVLYVWGGDYRRGIGGGEVGCGHALRRR